MSRGERDEIDTRIKICSDQILAQLINQGVAAAHFSSRCPKNLQNGKIFVHLEIAEIDMRGQEKRFWT